MMYLLKKKCFGLNEENIISFDIDFDIVDFSYIENFGFLFLVPSSHIIGRIDLDNKIEFPWIGKPNESGKKPGPKEIALLNLPSSICFNKRKKEYFITEDIGSCVRTFDVNSNYILPLLSSSCQKKIDKYFSKIKGAENVCVQGDIDEEGNFYWVNGVLNLGFKFKHSEFEVFVGSGKSGYSVSNGLRDCLLNSPSGIACYKDFVYISDSGNHCIRKINKNKIFLVAGDPKQSGDKDGIGINCLLDFPSKIKIKKNIAYFIDKNKIKYLSLDNNIVGEIYKSDNIVSMCMNDNRDLYILERT